MVFLLFEAFECGVRASDTGGLFCHESDIVIAYGLTSTRRYSFFYFDDALVVRTMGVMGLESALSHDVIVAVNERI